MVELAVGIAAFVLLGKVLASRLPIRHAAFVGPIVAGLVVGTIGVVIQAAL